MAMAEARAEFEEGLQTRIDQVYKRAAGRFPDHRTAHGWVTGYLGDPFASVWFIAENPSLTQVEKITAPHPTSELQWTMSAGDKLLRRLLAKYGFKEGGELSPGGWCCYLTDVIKSTALVKDHNMQSEEALRATARAWAPVLRWELDGGRPRIVVAMGNRARSMLNYLIETGEIPDPANWDAWRTHIPHYVYVASRPDIRRRGLPRWFREDEYDQKFATISALHDALPVRLRVQDGGAGNPRSIRSREYLIGTPAEIHEAGVALRAIPLLGSNFGVWSNLFAELLYGPRSPLLEAAEAGQLAREATDLLDRIGAELDPSVRQVFVRVAAITGSPRLGARLSS
jgi:uracil-DNA glycosylase